MWPQSPGRVGAPVTTLAPGSGAHFSCWNEPKQSLGSIVKYGEVDLVNLNQQKLCNSTTSITLQILCWWMPSGRPTLVRGWRCSDRWTNDKCAQWESSSKWQGNLLEIWNFCSIRLKLEEYVKENRDSLNIFAHPPMDIFQWVKSKENGLIGRPHTAMHCTVIYWTKFKACCWKCIWWDFPITSHFLRTSMCGSKWSWMV